MGSPAAICELGVGGVDPALAIGPVTEKSEAATNNVSTATISRRLASLGRTRRPTRATAADSEPSAPAEPAEPVEPSEASRASGELRDGRAMWRADSKT